MSQTSTGDDGLPVQQEATQEAGTGARVTITGPVTAPLAEDDLDRLRSYGVAESVEVGQIVMAPGQVEDLILVDTGRVELVMDDIPGAAGWQPPSCGPGTFVNELTLLTGQRSYLTARVSEAGRIYRVDQAGFRALMEAEPELSTALLTVMLARRARIGSGPVARTLEIIGSSLSAASHALRTYAARQQLVHAWLDADDVTGRAVLQAAGLEPTDLPAVLTAGTVLRRATPAQLADLLGLSYQPSRAQVGAAADTVDLIVVGAGPAGLAAAVYGASEGLQTMVLDAVAPGGQAAASSRIENYLGFPTGLSGSDLMTRALVQAQKFGARLTSPCTVAAVQDSDGTLGVVLDDGSEISGRTLLIATGAAYRSLPLPRWSEFEDAGIYYAATELEVQAHAGRPVVVLGGANSAGQAALHLASRGSQVLVVIRGDDLQAGMSAYLADRLLADARVHVTTRTNVTALHGRTHLEGVTLSTVGGSPAGDQVECTALFCFIGAVPATSWLRGQTQLMLDGHGFVKTDTVLDSADLSEVWTRLGRLPLPFETSLPSVFAAGDVRAGSVKRVAAAVGEGSSVIRSVHTVLGVH